MLLPPTIQKGWDAEDWLDWERPYDLVIGESRYKEAIRSLIPSVQSGTEMTFVPVEVVYQREPANMADRNAIKATIKRKKVGYLPRDLASSVAPKMDAANLKTMKFAGMISGKDYHGVAVWPGKALSEYIPIEFSSGEFMPRRMPDAEDIVRLNLTSNLDKLEQCHREIREREEIRPPETVEEFRAKIPSSLVDIPISELKLQYRIPRSRSKKLEEILARAKELSCVEEHHDYFLVTFSGTEFQYRQDFYEFCGPSRSWKGAASVINDQIVRSQEWWFLWETIRSGPPK